MTTTPPTTTGTAAGEELNEAALKGCIASLRELVGLAHEIEGYYPNNAVDALDRMVASHRTLQRELAASREREARLREAGELVCERILPLLDIRSNLTFDPTALERAVGRWDVALTETEATR